MSTNVRSQLSLRELADEKAQEAHSRIPERNSWGFFAYDDSPVVAGGGMGGFLWFTSREEMYEFITQHLPFWYENPAAPNPDNVASELGRILGRFEEQQMNSDAPRQELNKILIGSARIAWWGRFRELASAQSEFARDVIRWFYTSSNPQENAMALDENEQLRLAAKINKYGA